MDKDNMELLMKLNMSVISAFALAAGLALGALPAAAGPGLTPTAKSVAAAQDHVVLASHARRDRRWSKRRAHRRHVTVVDAPFAYVETRGHRRTAVDAPFTSVRVGRRGTWVRAPFVDIYVPR
jgi:hypothetical protein